MGSWVSTGTCALCIVSVATSVESIVLPTDTFICKRHDCSRIYCSEDSGRWISLECFCIETSMNAVSWCLVSIVKDVEMQVTVNIYTVCNGNYDQSTPFQHPDLKCVTNRLLLKKGRLDMTTRWYSRWWIWYVVTLPLLSNLRVFST
jgi:hypothetical protein